VYSNRFGAPVGIPDKCISDITFLRWTILCTRPAVCIAIATYAHGQPCAYYTIAMHTAGLAWLVCKSKFVVCKFVIRKTLFNKYLGYGYIHILISLISRLLPNTVIAISVSCDHCFNMPQVLTTSAIAWASLLAALNFSRVLSRLPVAVLGTETWVTVSVTCGCDTRTTCTRNVRH